ncbi:hypothetical protein JCM17844_11620 [Iodidimonas gelatinilytica]|uniref:Outer membrane lipoprotein carrier protein LolA n=1 Tax=Iodidimonas gelatinilytica TaxID=1236966 RepID=A0A5A7MRA6_9PROT|nr:outer membrane lipoprotein carrier protein LolA [Iodidimonas gelatinilytica]GEQ97525.1 hypothetical protein JCM17844_11620 [Iodidimonas gelatinilytica]
MARDLLKALFFSLGSFAAIGVSAQDVEKEADSDAPPALEERHVDSVGLMARINKIETFLNGIDTLKSTFVQIADDGTISRGVLSLDRPGRMRFEYSDGTPLLLVSDGEVLSFIDYDVGQVTRWPINDTPLALLVAKTVDLQSVNAMVNRLDVGGQAVYLVSVEDQEAAERGNLTLLIEERADGSLFLRGWEVVDGQGAVTRIRLENPQLNPVLADSSLWRFKDPRKLPSQRRKRVR